MYFKINYLLGGKYKQKYIGKIKSWENGVVCIRDQQLRVHSLKEKYISKIQPTANLKAKKITETTNNYEQLRLF